MQKFCQNTIFGSTARPRDTRPRGVRTLEIHGFELDPKTLEIHGFWPKALKMHGFILVSKHLRYTVLAKSLEDARFFSFGVLDSKEI